MDNCINNISPNLAISNNPNFGDYNRDVVFNIIRFVDINLSNCLGIEPFSSSKCLIDYTSDTPEIQNSKIYEFKHVIYLSTRCNYWCQWVYQFAHEYCHHLINGNMSGDLDGCIWFEESLCEASSLYNLISLEKEWRHCTNNHYKCYAQSIKQYIDKLQEKRDIRTILDASKKIMVYKQDCNGNLDYNRDLYHRIASSILLPQMMANPFLWKIISHIGNARNWNSIIDLMEHLVKTAENSYLNSAKVLQKEFYSIIEYLQE